MSELPIIAVIDYVQAQMKEVEGIRAAPKRPPDKISLYPFTTCFPGTGDILIGNPAGNRRDIHTLILEVHVARKDLPADINRVLPLVDRIGDKLKDDPTLGGNVETIVGSITYVFGPLGWFGQETIGWQFQVPVKIIN